MNVLICTLTMYILFAIYLNFTRKDNKKINTGALLYLGAAALFVRILVAHVSEGYETDMNCFRAWSHHASSVLPWEFYDSVWCDYPPGYLYILSVVGFLRNIFPAASDVIIKLPSMICDILCAAVICKTAYENREKGMAEVVFCLCLFNVATIVNGALWGQVDSVFTLITLISLINLKKEKYVKSAVFFGISISLKIQALMFGPVYVFFLAEKFITTKDKKLIKEFLKSVIITLGTVILISLPFIVKKGVPFLINLYFTTSSQYPYASLNAFNFFSMIEANLKPNSEIFCVFSYKVCGMISICMSVIVCGVMYLKGKGKGKLFYTAALLMLLIYTFSSDMHERYLFPAMALFFMAGVLNADKKTQIIGLLVSVLQAVNVGYLYFLNLNGITHIPPKDMVLIWGSIITVLLALFAVYNGFKLYMPKREKVFYTEEINKKITRKDATVICIITMIYAIVSFINLGDTKIPSTMPETGGEKVIYNTKIEFEKEENIGKIVYYKGLGHGRVTVYEYNADEDMWQKKAQSEDDAVYRWNCIDSDIKAKSIAVRIQGDENFEVFEIGVIEKGTYRVIPILKNDCKLQDEQWLVKPWDSFENGTYFDEIYHARTAYEHIEGIYPYEISHPPLGKLIIAAGIRMFGMNPFGWRFMGNLAGILMVPLMYVFAKRIFGKSGAATLATLFLSFDFMHFVQTRIATIDSFSVLFIMLMYYLMYLYYEEGTNYKKSLLLLALCGVVFGLGISTKWICVYSVAGLAILFTTATIKKAKSGFKWFKTCLWCILFFVVIPFCIYFVSYTPYYMADNTRSAWDIFVENQQFMLSYHSKLTATHPFQSKWYTWPVVMRPIWYFGATGGLNEGNVSSIVSFGNPLIWWCASASAVVLMFKEKKNRSDMFILIGYFSQFVPWMLVNRAVFIYHYFASVPFIILALVKGCEYVKTKYRNGFYVIVAFATVTGCLFCMFYPVLSGMEVNKNYVDNVLSWIGTWVLSY